MCKWLSKSFFFTSRETQKQALSYSIIVFSRGCQPHLPLSAALFPSQKGFTCLLLVSPRAPTSPKKRQRSRNSISFVLENSAWTCDCDTHDIMALELVPDPHAFFYSFYFTSYALGECFTSLHVFSFFFFTDTLRWIISLTFWMWLKLLRRSVFQHTEGRIKGDCIYVCVCVHGKEKERGKKTRTEIACLCVWLGL